ncbi:chromosome partitioning protein [Clavibacter sepedonicus]|uniref:Chromosome partitioning protein n=1 Tax=Clavibacter sepedonicus TaxID=31964 RepID=B0RJ43_CLASE|nr:chromosome partitioning protein [Clavibacter sepedonicus]OQJ50906.1 chromosome partitioning protein [Clavibacter sepedonicus]CAQ03233.1 chromosome partitioning protein [Clavibacter sepedonicus]
MEERTHVTITENTTSTNGVTEYLDPNTLIIEENVRPSADLNREFVQSIKANGVLVPVIARRDSEGRVLVRAGQRRTLGARQAGVATIPVHVIDADEATTDRIVQQLVENDQRTGLTDVDRTVAFKQLQFEGLSAAAISKRTGTGPRVVKKTLAVANTPSAAAALTDHQLTLDQAAALVEFDEYPDLQARLIETARAHPAQFDHQLRYAQQDLARKHAVQAVAADHESRGYVIVDPQNPEHADFVPVRDLVTVEGGDALLTPEKMDTLDGRGVRVVAYLREPEAVYYLRDPQAVGYRRDETTGTRTSPATGAGSQTEEQKAERRRVIANNKAWDAAESVRREFVAALVTRRSLPKDAGQVIAAGLTTHRHEVGRAVQEGSPLAHEFLGVERDYGYYGDGLGKYAAATPTKAQHVALAVVLGGMEAALNRDSWRSVSAPAAAYLRQLAAWGYTLSEVEQIVPDADDSRRAQRDADDADESADAAEGTSEAGSDTTEPGSDTTEPETDTNGRELDTEAAPDLAV